MKYLLLLLVLTALTGCYDDSDDTINGPTDTINNDSDDTSQPPLAWGELRCQKNLTCKNPVLNIDSDSLIFFFESRFGIEQESQGASESRSFYCGQKFFADWVDFYPHHQNIKIDQANDVSELGLQLLDLKKCMFKENLKNNLNNYLTLTQEYKNEIR